MTDLSQGHEAIGGPDSETQPLIRRQVPEGDGLVGSDSGSATPLSAAVVSAASREGGVDSDLCRDDPVCVPASADDREDRASIESLARSVASLATGQEELRDLFETWSRRGDAQGKALEVLRDQLEDYRKNFVRQEMTPLLREVIDCYDVVEGELAGAAVAPDAGTLVRGLAHLKQMILDLLSKHDIEPFRHEGDGFDRATQHCVRSVPTAVDADDRKIAAVGFTGFRRAEAILRKEQVTVFKYTPSLVAAPESATL